jgi:hypothetical protein
MLYILPALVLIHLIAVVVTGRQLQGDIDRLTKAGILAPVKDLIPTLPPGAENAADVYQQAWRELRLSAEDESVLFDQYAKHDANWFALARRVVAANPEYYRLVDRASRMTHCVFPVDWEPMFSASFPHLSQMRRAARMLALRSYVDAADGRIDSALASVAAVFRVGEQAKTDPVIIAELVSYGIQAIGVRALEDVLPTGVPSPAACRSLYDRLARTDNLTSSARAVKSEAVLMGMDVFDWVRSGRISITEVISSNSGQVATGRRPRLLVRLHSWLWRPFLNADQRIYLSFMEKEVRAFERPWPESRDTTAELSAWLGPGAPFYAVLTRAVMPIYGRAVESRDRATAAIGTARIALALKAYRADHPAYPASLAELETMGWKLPPNPFGGKPYRYRREGAGFVVWSIGPDMRDQNASIDYEIWLKTKSQKGWEEGEYDIVFRAKR